MSLSPRLQQFLQEFTQSRGAKTPRIEADDLGVTLTLDQNTVIGLREDSAREVLILSAALPLPNRNQRSRFQSLLAESLFAPDFDRAFAMSADGKTLYLQGAFDLAVVAKTGLAPVLAKFAKIHAGYRTRLRETAMPVHGRPEYATGGMPILGPQLFA